MAVSSSPVDASESLHHDEIGIHPFHAYSLLDIKQIGTERYVFTILGCKTCNTTLDSKYVMCVDGVIH